MRNTSSRALVRGTRRYFIYFVLSIIVIILTSLGTFEIIKGTDLLTLEKVEVLGQSDELNFHIEQDLKDYLGINLYKLDLESIKDTLVSDYSIISDMNVNRRIPNKIKIKYTLEIPFVIVNFSDGKNFYANRDLKLLERVNYGYLRKSLPVLTSKLNSKNYQVGTVIQDSITHVIADHLADILEVRADFQDRISDLFSKNGKVYFRETSRGNIVYLGNGDISDKIDLFLSHCNSFSSGLYIDISFNRQIVTRKAEL